MYWQHQHLSCIRILGCRVVRLYLMQALFVQYQGRRWQAVLPAGKDRRVCVYSWHSSNTTFHACFRLFQEIEQGSFQGRSS